MIKIVDKSKCCGCEACVTICPKHCISFKPDQEGFYYPSVDTDICVKCGLCEKVCPVINICEQTTPPRAYAAKNPNEDERKMSSSGGVFIIIAREVIKQGGVVFGARFDETWNVVHSYTEDDEGLSVFMGSKYVQSRIGNTYIQARDFLNAGRQVLYSGTPCQIAGLRNFLRKDYDNLLTVDVICHGVPSPMVWQEYISEIKENARKGENTVSFSPNHPISEGNTLIGYNDVKIEGIAFRDKSLGWKKFSFALTLAEATADGKKNSVSLSYMHKEDPFMQVFLNNTILRHSCYKCPSKSGRSGSDITLGDFWGIEKLKPDFDDDKGVSLVLINTKKGSAFINNINVNLLETSIDDAISNNPAYLISVAPHPNRSKFFKLFQNSKHSVIGIIGKSIIVPYHKRAMRLFKRIIKRLMN